MVGAVAVAIVSVSYHLFLAHSLQKFTSSPSYSRSAGLVDTCDAIGTSVIVHSSTLDTDLTVKPIDFYGNGRKSQDKLSMLI